MKVWTAGLVPFRKNEQVPIVDCRFEHTSDLIYTNASSQEQSKVDITNILSLKL